MKRLAMWIVTGVLAGTMMNTAPVVAQAGGGTKGGVDIGAVLPLNSFDRYSTTGFVLAPWLGYMFNEYIGVMAQAQGLVAPNRSRGISFEEVSAALAGAVGPRVEVPLGPLELYGTFQIGGLTGLTAPSSITDTSWGFSTGGGINFDITETLSVGAWARWNRWYQRVRHTQAQFPDPTKPNGNVACPQLRRSALRLGRYRRDPQIGSASSACSACCSGSAAAAASSSSSGEEEDDPAWRELRFRQGDHSGGRASGLG